MASPSTLNTVSGCHQPLTPTLTCTPATSTLSPPIPASEVRCVPSSSITLTLAPGRHFIFLTRSIAGQNVFFHLNHPIQWVRVAGIVAAVDEYPGRRIYTLDDSSGACIECTVDIPRTDTLLAAAVVITASKVGPAGPAKAEPKNVVSISAAAAPPPPPKATVPAEVDVGTVIDVKGGLTLFRGHKQIKILKAIILRSTEQEVAFWEKVEQFRRDVLEKPWRLTDREVKRCRKDEERRK